MTYRMTFKGYVGLTDGHTMIITAYIACAYNDQKRLMYHVVYFVERKSLTSHSRNIGIYLYLFEGE